MSQAGSINNGNGPGSGNVRTLTGNSGGPVPPDGIGNIDVIGSGGITVTGNPGTNTLTINDGGSASTFVEDAGTAHPIAGVININGANNIFTTGDGNNNISVTLTQGLDGQVLIGATAADAAWENITSTGATITITNGPNTINLETAGGSGTTQFDADTGTAAPVAGVINIFGGPNINTSAAGNTVDVNLDTSINLPDTNVGFTTGTLLLNSVPFLHNFGGTGGGGGGSANIFLGENAGNDTLSSGNNNIGIGSPALSAIDDGFNNIAIGSFCLNSMDSGNANIGIGDGALFVANSVTAANNVAIGDDSCFNLTTGFNNVGVGVGSAFGLTVESDNVAIGNGALNGGSGSTSFNVAVGSSTFGSGCGGHNVGIGFNTGSNLGGTGDSNIYVSNIGVAAESNTIRIGTQGTGDGQQDAAFMAGVYQATVGVTHEFVIVDNTGKLGSTPSSGAAGVKITTFMMSGTFTKDTNSKYIELYAWGGGAGGGSGRQGANTAAGGGGGGGAGMAFQYAIPSSFWNATTTITVGAGGTGGAAQAGANTDGNVGAIGGVTVVGSIDNTGGNTGQGGGGGTTTVTVIATGGEGFGSFIHNSATNGASGSNVDPSNAQASALDNRSLTGTGGGAGSGADTGTPRQASNGGDYLAPNNSTVIIAGGIGGIETGTINGTNGNNQPTTDAVVIGGTGGGGGGGQSSGIVAGTGGNGGFPGGGGGGGGGSINGTNSGAGGNGADGYVLIIEFLG
jgi:hypothetical protein